MRNLFKISVSMAALVFVSITPAKSQTINYEMMEGMFGEPVTTSGNGSPQRKSQVALNMEILTADEIKRSGARTIPEVLRFIPGVDVRRHSFGQTEVSIRGYNQANSERILVLVNGRQVYSDFFGLVNWNNIPVEMSEIQQIEVVKGPNTALFGFNAVSGVVNIITVDPLQQSKTSMTARTGSLHMNEVSGVSSQQYLDGKVGVRFSGGGYRVNEVFDDFDKRVAKAGKRDSYSLDVRTQVTDTIQTQFETTRNYTSRNENLIVNTAGAYSRADARSIRGRVIADTKAGLVEADVYHNFIKQKFTVLSNDVPIGVGADNRVTVAKINDTFEYGSEHIFRIGGEYRQATNILESTAAALDQDDLRYEIYSASGLWDWAVSDKIHTSVAARYDNFELSPDGNNISPTVAGLMASYGLAHPYTSADYFQKREEFSYNIGAVYEMTEKDTLRASIARGVDLPSFTEFGMQFAAGASGGENASAMLGSPYVDTSVVHNFELGWDRKISEIEGLFRGAIFYQYSNEMQVLGGEGSAILAAGTFDQTLFGNDGDSEMFGAEIGFEGKFEENWNWAASYTFIEIDDDFNSTVGGVFYSKQDYEDSVANHTITASIGYIAEKWNAEIDAQYKSGFYGLTSDTTTATSMDSILTDKVRPELMLNANFSYHVTDNATMSISGNSLAGTTSQYEGNDAETMLYATLEVDF